MGIQYAKKEERFGEDSNKEGLVYGRNTNKRTYELKYDIDFGFVFMGKRQQSGCSLTSTDGEQMWVEVERK